MTFTPPDAQLEFVILSYNKDPNIRTSSKKIIEDADKLGLRPATFAELVTLGIVMPDFNKRSEYLVGLGTEQLLDGMLWVPCLRWDGDERSLDAVRCDSVWGERDRFLFVCK